VADDRLIAVASLGGRGLAFAMWTMPGLFFGLAYSLIRAGHPTPALAIPGGLGAICGVASAVRLRFDLGQRGVVVRNPVKTYRFGWDDVAAVGVSHFGLIAGSLSSGGRPALASGRTSPGFGFRLRDGKRIPVAVATTYLPGDVLQQMIDLLKGNLDLFGVSVTISIRDFGAR
jgi:hypothetical protein